MDGYEQFEGSSRPQMKDIQLARWLQQVMTTPPPGARESSIKDESFLEPLLRSDYHLHFYQQLPDFIIALLKNDTRASVHYAPLLYHLAGCQECHKEYLDLYDALRAAIDPREARPILGQGTRTLAATPPRMLGHLCQTLLSMAESILRQERYEHMDASAHARSLLQLALGISAHIKQSNVRRQALYDLVRVATLFDGPEAPKRDDSETRSYTLAPVGAAGTRGRTVRRAEALTPPSNMSPEQAAIVLRSRSLEGRIVQHGRVLELQLRDLDEALRGRYVVISVTLGSLLEPIRWRSGNPNMIRSVVPVDEHGALVTPLGETDLRLTEPEEHNLIEAIFMLLEVRADG